MGPFPDYRFRTTTPPRESYTREAGPWPRPTSSGDVRENSPQACSPRYTSTGYYATAGSASAEWQNSRTYRASRGESDEDEYIHYLVDGIIYRVLARWRKPVYNDWEHDHYPRYYSRAQYAHNRDSFRGSPLIPPRRRRHSSSTPRPQSSHMRTSPNKPPSTPNATQADSRQHRFPPGYSLKNWDPSEEPIMLLGSVFDANRLGKWIYDWTVYHHGPVSPIADMAGELWLLLISLTGKVKHAEECMPRIRKGENREMVQDFIESGERLTDKLKKLLKSGETAMLKAGKKHSKDQAKLGENAGIEFVKSIFGRDRQLEQTEKFMSSIRLWNLRFDANCEDVLRRPGQ